MSKYVYVDSRHVWFEGMRVSSVERGLAFDIIASDIKNEQPSCKLDKIASPLKH